MLRLSIYRVLVGALGIAFLLMGFAMIAAFFAYQRPGSVPLIPTGPIGHYWVAFTGCAMLGWAGGLIGAARHPLASRTVSTMTVFVLALMAVLRMIAWLLGDYAGWLGDLPRREATLFLVLALALVWARPTVKQSRASAGAVPEAEATSALPPQVTSEEPPGATPAAAEEGEGR